MKVSIAYADNQHQHWQSLQIDEGATVADVIHSSGLLDLVHIDLDTHKVGIFGKVTKLDAQVKDGDRVEIYNAITRVLDDDDDDDDD